MIEMTNEKSGVRGKLSSLWTATGLFLAGSSAAVLLVVALPGGVNEEPVAPAMLVGNAGTHWVRLVDHLPSGYVTDGSVNYTSAVQDAIDAAGGGTLKLPDFPVLVARTPGQNWCLRARRPIRILGGPSSVIRELQGGVQILRVADTNGVQLEGFTVEGPGSDGTLLAHGLVQIFRCEDVRIDGLTVTGADADGIAVAVSKRVQLTNCTVSNASKSALYVNGSEDALVSGNIVTDFGGHHLVAYRVGAGIQLSSNASVVCSDNSIHGGLGIGILCNANQDGAKPDGNVITGNRIENVRNGTNNQNSSGIRCANGHQDKATQTLVANNTIRNCGLYGVFLENHGGSTIVGNTIVESERDGILIATVEDVLVSDNSIFNSNTTAAGNCAAIHLVDEARRVTTRDNLMRNLDLFANAFGSPAIKNDSSAGGHTLEPRIAYLPNAPQKGWWSRGDIVFNSGPNPGEPAGWMCTEKGTPGSWSAFGTLD